MRICIESGAAALVFSLFLPLATGQDPATPQQGSSSSSSGQSGSSGAASGTSSTSSATTTDPLYIPPPMPGGRGARGGPWLPGRSAVFESRIDQQENMKDATALALLSARLKREIEESKGMVLSVETVRKTDEIEKLVKRIHARLVHN